MTPKKKTSLSTNRPTVAGHHLRGSPHEKKPEPKSPQLVTDNATAGLMALLKIEADAREAHTPKELQFLIVNETRKIVRARHVFVLLGSPGDLAVAAISGLPNVDRGSPLVQGIEHIVESLSDDVGLLRQIEFALDAYTAGHEDFVRGYPFHGLLWAPFLNRDGELMGGMLLAREQPWLSDDGVIAGRLARTYAHAFELLLATPKFAAHLALRLGFGWRSALLGLALASVALAIPVPMAALAPCEIAPSAPFIVAAPIDGVIQDILADPGAEVAQDQPIVRFSDTVLRNRLEVAEREVMVAEARLKKATQLGFDDPRGRRELGVAMSEFAVKTAERDFARDLFQRTTIRATRSGLAVYSDKNALIGKPVVVGERIMQIADPAQVEVAIELSSSDAIVLKQGARAKVYLDSDPLHPREATVTLADYQAHVRPGNTLAFRVTAKLAPDSGPLPRLGVRGTAQLYGGRVMLGFYLFRRPVAAIRQWTGL